MECKTVGLGETENGGIFRGEKKGHLVQNNTIIEAVFGTQLPRVGDKQGGQYQHRPGDGTGRQEAGQHKVRCERGYRPGYLLRQTHLGFPAWGIWRECFGGPALALPTIC